MSGSIDIPAKANTEQSSVGQARYYHDKKAFINSQVRLLEAPIRPSSDWRRHRARLTEQGEAQASIPDAVVASVLSKVHAISKKFLRLSFNSQSVRQLLEQLESNQYELRRKAKQGGIIIRTKSIPELLNSDWIDMFPETWQHGQGIGTETLYNEGPNQIAARPSATPLATISKDPRVQKYAQLRSRIVTLQARHSALKDKHEYYKTLQNEIRRLDAGQIEKNILAPDSQVYQELTKMKLLLPKVIHILDSRRDVVLANRELKPRDEDIGAETATILHAQPRNPLDTMMDCFDD
ncbi:hypothetical protein BGZ68_007553 [Mortierella alpina]|nr:hypothetical protein BGZ68_007553 [Mortierella alpina]